MADIPEIPASPPAPARTQSPDTFSLMADRFAAYIEQMPVYYNAFGDAMETLANEIANQGFSVTSTTPMTIGTGTKSFTASTGAAFIGGQTVLISSTASPANGMTGTVVSYNSVTGFMEVNVASVTGSGSFSAWSIALTLSVDLSGYLQKAGGTMTGPLALPASVSGAAPLNVPQGVAPTSPADGDIWSTSAGWFIRIAGVTLKFATLTTTETLSNKRIPPRFSTQSSITSPLALNTDTLDYLEITAQASNLTINADAGTPLNGEKKIIAITASAADRTITFTGGVSKGFRDATLGLLTVSGSNWTYVIPSGKTRYIGLIYNATAARHDIAAITGTP